MKRYPWLINPYKIIIKQHQIKKTHHAFLIKTIKGLGVCKLILEISKWLLCNHRNGIKCCKKCHSCQLMLSGNHPDWHQYISKKDEIITVNHIREINEKIFKYPKQGKNKIIFLSNIQKMTESAKNALLKTLEEPPKNTWFFLIDYNNLRVNSTLHSRCLIYILSPPLEKNSLSWLKNQNLLNKKLNLIALRIYQGSPISAKKFINDGLWEERNNLFLYFLKSIKNQNLLKILPILSIKNTILKIDWICLLLFDSIQLYFNQKKKLTNFDQLELIQFFSSNYNYFTLHQSIYTWTKCRYRLLNIPSINSELLLLEQLLKWEKILSFVI
ncbi:DNA polymerase III subunit delta' [Buchnera aphidicola (Aphis glycines)]|uniref:DNA polymerase III subunit delta' n=2 Tax=Buchnera aphidicola TaxID=9 RepID=A0A0M4HX19_9GAMM|nr:DNA polymerase III subunit delta' [Buchnera aphidicola (Aphis glycines)]